MKTRFWVNLVLVVIVCVFGCKKKQIPSESKIKEPDTKVKQPDTKVKQPETKVKQPVVRDNKEKKMSISKESFGQTPDGEQVELYTLTNVNGLTAKVTNYGAILVAMEVPDDKGQFADITLGYDNLESYIKKGSYFGATVGRYANRIGGAKFTLEGVEYKLLANNGDNHLHGGKKGFDKVVWKVEEAKSQDDKVFLKMSYLSKDGEEGYPGNLACSVTYTLTKNDELKFNYEATTDKTTILNLTNHSYWNLAGEGNGDILGHKLMLLSNNYTPVDEGLIPTGEIKSVRNSAMDFTKPMTIGSRIKEVGMGYDHNYVNNNSGTLCLSAIVYEPLSKRVMEIHTTEPGIQFYTGNFLDGSITGKSGGSYIKHAAFCLETQHFPDSPNKPDFPSVVLTPEQTYTTETVHKFYTNIAYPAFHN